MLKWALIFFVAALLAAAVGFTNVFNKGVPTARVLFFILIALFLIMFLPAIL